MVEERSTSKSVLRKVISRLFKAAFWAFLMGGEVLFVSYILGLSEYTTALLPVEGPFFFGFMVTFILFEVAIQLLSETIFRYVISVTRAFISMIYLILMTNGGIMKITIPPEMVPFGVGTIIFTVEFRTILAVFLMFSLISILKNLIQAINFLSERAELPFILPKIP